MHCFKKVMILSAFCTMSTMAMATDFLTATQILNADTAARLAHMAMSECRQQGYRVSAAVVDRSGNLLAMSRHELAGPHTVTSSQKKAYTVASMGRATADLAQLVTDKPVLAGLRDMNDNLLLLGGGIPVEINGQTVAGIGVGGAPGGHLDTNCARKAIASVVN